MIKYIFLPIWWALRFFVFFPLVNVCGIIVMVIWDIKSVGDFKTTGFWEYTPDEIGPKRYYKSPWHYLLGYPPI